MPVSKSRPESLSRTDAIAKIRRALLPYVDQETSICRAAAERGFFCHGFKRYGDNELRRKYAWIVRKRPDLTRDELEEIANSWQLAQQTVQDIGFACDVQTKVHDTCCGWDDFTDDQLSEFYRELTGRELVILPV